MVQRRRWTAKSRARSRVRRTSRKAKTRAKKGVRRVAQSMRITPAQRKRLNQMMRDFQQHINAMTRKYNQLLGHVSRL